MPRKGWKVITIPDYLYDRFEKEYKSSKEEYRKKFGITSLSAFVAKVLSERLEALEGEKPRLEHLNTLIDHVKVIDNVMNRIADVYFNGGGKVYCDVCEKDSCIHIDYALGLPEVVKALKERGWRSV